MNNYDKIINIHNFYFHNKWTYKDIELMNKLDNYTYLVLYEKNSIVAYIILYNSLDNIDIFEIAVDIGSTRQGYASSLLKELFQIQKKIKKDVFLEVNEENEKAILLYRVNNFLEISIRKNYYKDNKNAIIMVRKYDT